MNILDNMELMLQLAAIFFANFIILSIIIKIMDLVYHARTMKMLRGYKYNTK